GADDDTVVPVGRPRAAHDQPVRVDWSAVKERDLLRMRGVSPIEYGNSALIKRLHHHVAARYRDERTVVRDAVFLVRLRSRDFVIAVEDQVLVLDGEQRVGAPFRLVGGSA